MGGSGCPKTLGLREGELPPALVLGIWALSVVLVLRWLPDKPRGSITVLLVPTLWIFLAASRTPTQWLNGSMGVVSVALEEGSPLDRVVLGSLLVVAAVLLVCRQFPLGSFIRANIPLATLLGYALISALWSDYPLISAKRWVRDLGNYLIVMLILSERDPLSAYCEVFRRVLYAGVSLSVVLIKYFPGLGISYSYWSGKPEYIGAALSKNTLGVLCLISILFLFWDTVRRFDAGARGTRLVITFNIVMFAVSLWVLRLSVSATSTICVVLGCIVVLAARNCRCENLVRSRIFLPGTVLALMISFHGGMSETVARIVGRDPSLTDRTAIWSILTRMEVNPVLGVGYETFWLGSRLHTVWMSGFPGINEAHNGYLQRYLDLGGVGVVLLLWFIVAAFAHLRHAPAERLGLYAALWVILLVYNITEAAFMGGLVWIALLPGAVRLPARTRGQAFSFSRQSMTGTGTRGVRCSVGKAFLAGDQPAKCTHAGVAQR